MIDASASARRSGSSSSASSGLVCALTRSSVWNVETSGRSSACLSEWPASPGEPVVGVDRVDRTVLVSDLLHPRPDAVGERVDQAVEVLLCDWTSRPGNHVVQPESRLDLDLIGRPCA